MSTYVFKPLPKHYSTSRSLRNEAERQRRDRLNHYVSELATLVPFVQNAKKRVDKTSILRLAASYLRLHKVLKSDTCLSKLPASLNGEPALRDLFNSIGGFFLVITNRGKIVFVSEAIEDSFGYAQSDVLGHCLYTFIHEEDRQLLKQQLQPKDSQRRSFYCRLMEKNQSRADTNSRYQIIHIMGHMKNYSPHSDDYHRSGQDKRKSPTDAPFLLNREERYLNGDSSSSDFSSEEETSSNGDDDSQLLVAFVKVVRDRLVTELTWVESMRDEYITRHKLNGSMVHVDHRISFVTGFMPEQVLGKSAFDYMHPDDVCWSILAQKQMLLNVAGQGIVTYRLRCTDGSFIVLRSRGFLEVDKNTGKIDTFISINTLLSINSASDEVVTQRKKLLPMLKDGSVANVEESVGSGLPPELQSLLQTQGNLLGKFASVVGNVASKQSEEVDISKLMFYSTLDSPRSHQETSTVAPIEHNDMQFSREHATKRRNFIQDDTSIKLRRRSAESAEDNFEEVCFSPEEGTPSNITELSCRTQDLSPFSSEETCWTDDDNLTSLNRPIRMQNKKAVSYSTRSPNWNNTFETCTTSCEVKNTILSHVQPSYSEISNWGYPNYSPDFPNHLSNQTNGSPNNCPNFQVSPDYNSHSHLNGNGNACQNRITSCNNHFNGISDVQTLVNHSNIV